MPSVWQETRPFFPSFSNHSRTTHVVYILKMPNNFLKLSTSIHFTRGVRVQLSYIGSECVSSLGKILFTIKMHFYNKSITCIIAFAVTFDHGVFLIMKHSCL